MGERGGFVGGFELGKGLGHAGKAKLAQLVEHWTGGVEVPGYPNQRLDLSADAAAVFENQPPILRIR